MVETVSHTDYHTYNVSSYAGGSVTINIDTIDHSDRSARYYTVGVYFTDINNQVLHQQNNVPTTYYPDNTTFPNDEYNQVVLVMELNQYETLTNQSYNVPVPAGAHYMHWFAWRMAGPFGDNNAYWDLQSGDKFLIQSQASNGPVDQSHAGYLKYSFTTRVHYDDATGTIVAKSDNSRVKGLNIFNTHSTTSPNFSSNPNTDSAINLIYTNPSVTGGEVYFRSPDQFKMTGITVTGEPYVNQGPTVVVPADTTVLENTLVTLSSTGTFDPDGDELTYSWTQISGPAVTINNANTATASFTTLPMHWTDTNIVYGFSLGVSDGINPTVYDFVDITAQAEPNAAPQVNAVVTESVNGGDTLNYTGITPYDPDGDTLSYFWEQISGPEVHISDQYVKYPEIITPTLQFGADNVAILRCTVTDTGSLTATHELRIVIATEANQAPTAVATSDKDNINGEVVTLSGAASIDPEGYGLTYSWEDVSSTSGVVPSLSAYNVVSPTFTAPTLVAGDSNVVITYRLTVTDSGGLTSTDDVVITVKAPVAPTTEASEFSCTTCGEGYCPAIATNILSNPPSTGSFSLDAKTYDPSNGALLNDGTSRMETFTFELNGESRTGYIGLNNILYVKRIKVSPRDIDDVNTYGYSYELASPVGRVGPDDVYYNYYV